MSIPICIKCGVHTHKIFHCGAGTIFPEFQSNEDGASMPQMKFRESEEDRWKIAEDNERSRIAVKQLASEIVRNRK